MVALGITRHCHFKLSRLAKFQQPKPPIAADGVQMPAEKLSL